MTQHGGDASGAERTAPEQLRLAHFSGSIGTEFPVEAAGGVHPLTLTQAETLPDSPREAGGFRLEFLGPPQPVLPQAIYPFVVDGQARAIFIVPLGPAPEGGMRYEATFF